MRTVTLVSSFCAAIFCLGSAFAPAAFAAEEYAPSSFASTDYTASVGIEGFRDRYNEPDPAVTVKSTYGSITGDYSHHWDDLSAGIDGRVSYGRDRYSSPSGQESGSPQWETELRGRAGLVLWEDDRGTLDSYLGLGMRYFMDEGKGKFSSIGDFFYDRRIMQFYVPVGVSYAAHLSDGFTLTPLLEYDQFLWGRVNSRLQNGGQYNPFYVGANLYNTQTGGYGLRSELMLSQKWDSLTSWEVGPFIRYWNISSSNVATAGYFEGYEPHNERTQVGLALKVLW